MPRVKVTRKFQITIPEEIRHALKIKEGDVLEVMLRGNVIIIKKLHRKRKTIKLGEKLSLEVIENYIKKGAQDPVSLSKIKKTK